MAESDDNNNSPVLNFRCPENIEKKIEAIGLEFYPKPIKTDKKGRLLNKRAYDVAQTILTIIEHGIDSINNDGIRTIDKTTQHTTEDITELRAAIADLKQNFENQLGEFKSLVFDDVVTMGVMNRTIETAIDNRLKSFQFESVASLKQETIQPTQPEPLPLLDAIDTATDNTAIAVSTIPVDNLAITPEKTIENSPKTDEINNQGILPITDTESLEGLNTRQLATTLGIPYTTLKDLKKQILEGREIDPKRKHYEKFSQWELRGEFWYKK